jgi:predicted metal-dependent phosphoesterase TrpH
MSADVIDLHTHTTHSDGSATPAELVRAAATNGARAIAITDHDTVSGLAEGRAEAGRAGIELVSGIEISAEYAPGTMHILGYCIDDTSAPLLAKLQKLKQARERRNPEIARRLQDLGCEITYQEVAGVAGNEVVGRPHFARILLEKGYVASIQEAFDRFLAKGEAAYVEKERLSPADAVGTIHRAGGAAVLAHPYQLKLRSMPDFERLLDQMVVFGLDGIEALYSRHSAEQQTVYSEIATRQGLLITGGSDYHGRYKPDIAVVRGLGGLRVPYALLEAIKERAAKRAVEARAAEQSAKPS